MNPELTVTLPAVDDNQLERLAAENPELVAECERTSREPIVAVVEERAEYNAGGEG